jgi:DNA-binding transcriptional MerR regulator
MAMSDETGYTIDDLAGAVGVPVRTVRYYLAEGLLPGPGKRGRGALYTTEHLRRLRLIRLLVERRVPLTDIRDQLADLDDADVERLLAREARYVARLKEETAADSPRGYVAALLQQAETAGDQPRARAAYSLAPPSAPPAPPSVRTEGWRRWPLLPGLEIHVRQDVAGKYRGLIERMIGLARGHDPPDAP